MSDALWVFVIMVAWIQGFALGYILWAPMTSFKQGFINGITFKWIWGKV